MIALIVVFIILTIFLLSGHGALLIAGYNTLPEHERQKYDTKKLSRSVGVLFVIIDLFLIAQLVLDYNNMYTATAKIFFTIITIAVIAAFVLWMVISKPYQKQQL